MALKITKQIEDSSGTIRTEIYCNIGKRYTYDKNTETLFTTPEYWANHTAYNEKKRPIEMGNDIRVFTVSVADAATQLLFDFLYNPFQAALIQKYGLVQGELWSDKTGTWQEVTI